MLYAHVDSTIVERSDVINSLTPAATKTHQPVPHGDYLKEVERAIQNCSKLTITEEHHALSENAMRYFSVLELKNGGGDDFNMAIGLRNSHDKHVSAGLAAGARVFVCDNLSFSGEVTVIRKHTSGILNDLPGLVEDAIIKVDELHGNQMIRFENYKELFIAHDRADHLMIELLRVDAIHSTQIPKILKEWEEPSHEEFAENGFTGWRFFNAVTEILKPKNQNMLFMLSRKTQKLHKILDHEFTISRRRNHLRHGNRMAES